MHLSIIIAVTFIFVNLFIECQSARNVSEKCSPICHCQHEENSSKVQFATCSVNSQNTLLQCSVEWTVLYLDVRMYQFDSNLLIRCQRIKRLKILDSSSLAVLKSDMFQYGKHLEILVVKARIQTLDSGLLRYLPSLQNLDISGTKIDIISHSIFDECPLNNTLRLASNEILSVDDESFKRCIYLLTLDLSRNSIRKINFATFRGAFNLNELDLSSNRIETIDDMSFKHLKKLKKLSLQNNQLQSVKQDTLHSLESLTYLRLENNKIVYIAPEAFRDLKAIQVINLKDNKMSRLDLMIFLNLRQLKIIFPTINCVQERAEDIRLVSADVLSEFNKYPVCDGKIRNTHGQPYEPSRQPHVQPDITTEKSRDKGVNVISLETHPYLIPMVLGSLTVTLISIIVIALVCHVKNQKIHELQLQEAQLPMMQSTL